MRKQGFVWKRGGAEKSQRKCKKPREEQSKDKQQRSKLNRALATAAEGWGSALPSVLHLLLPECCWGFPSWSRVLNKKVKPLDKNNIYTHI